MGADTGLHPDFGSGTYAGKPIGIPYTVVPADQLPVRMKFTDYADESDPGPYPIPFNAPIEGGPRSREDRQRARDADSRERRLDLSLAALADRRERDDLVPAGLGEA